MTREARAIQSPHPPPPSFDTITPMSENELTEADVRRIVREELERDFRELGRELRGRTFSR